jgi:hypothetical protein
MFEMGYYGNLNAQYAPCPNGNVCTGVTIEHLKLDSGSYPTTTGLNGIYNGNSQDLSYIDDVNLYKIGLSGISIAGASSTASGATNSGPYSRIDFTGANCSTSGCHPVCVDIETETRGLHGISCIGDSSVYGHSPPTYAGIYVNASNNSIEDAHLEGFFDGIEIGDTTATAVSNVVVSNVTAGNGTPVTNAVHICGAYNNQNLQMSSPDPCNSFVTNGSATDISIFGVKTSNSGCTMAIQDDVTGTSFGPDTSVYDSSAALPVGVYILGEKTVDNGGSGIAPGYSRFSTSPSVQTSTVPTWGVGNSTTVSGSSCVGIGSVVGANTYGALYSDTKGDGTSSHPYALYVCTGTPPTWQGIM